MCSGDDDLTVENLTEDPDYGWSFYTDGGTSYVNLRLHEVESNGYYEDEEGDDDVDEDHYDYTNECAEGSEGLSINGHIDPLYNGYYCRTADWLSGFHF